jgi:hypothetical protein
MKKSAWAEFGALRAMEIVPAAFLRPVLLDGSSAIGGNSLRMSLRTPNCTSPPSPPFPSAMCIAR